MTNYSNLAVINYKRFCQLEGSDYIASEFALETILRLIKTFKISTILELGLGIGSVSDTVLKFNQNNNLDIDYFGTEKNQFCLSVLPQYVSDFHKIKLYSELSDIKYKTFDFIIIDGLDDSLINISQYVNKHAILYVEGDRKIQTDLLLKLFPKHKYVNSITLKKNAVYVQGGRYTKNYIGGGQLIFINPTFKMQLYYFKEKIKTFLINKVRSYRKQ